MGHTPQGKVIRLPKKHPSGINQEPCQDGGGITQGTAQDMEESKDTHTVRMGRKKPATEFIPPLATPPHARFPAKPQSSLCRRPARCSAAARALHGISAEGEETQMSKRADSAAPSPQAHLSHTTAGTRHLAPAAAASRTPKAVAGNSIITSSLTTFPQRLLHTIQSGPFSPLPRGIELKCSGGERTTITRD